MTHPWCPVCFCTKIFVARDMLATRNCRNCCYTWLPIDDPQTDFYGKAPMIAALERAKGTPMTMELGTAIAFLKAGSRVSRQGWNGKGMWLELQYPDANSKMQRPYIYINPGEGWIVPWVASQADLLANDWYVVEKEKAESPVNNITPLRRG